jgi:glycosyltransferase involved in cell wall biosynthesis
VGDAPVVVEVAGSLEADPAYVRLLRDFVDRHRLAERVIFHGQLDAAGLTGLLRRAQVFALPSDRESYPISGIEALGFGLPLLITSAGGTAELLGQEKPGSDGCGQLLRPDDPAGWSTALAGLARDRGALAAAGAAALQRYRGHGTWLDTARVIAEMCERVLAVRS